jgi:hypothetical protein
LEVFLKPHWFYNEFYYLTDRAIQGYLRKLLNCSHMVLNEMGRVSQMVLRISKVVGKDYLKVLSLHSPGLIKEPHKIRT